MKLLFDQNLSSKLVHKLTDCYPGSKHVRELGLQTASDTNIWVYARDNNLVIVSKDTDFNDRAEILGFPPKLIWIHKQNCPTAVIESILRENFLMIERFIEDLNTGVLILT